MAPMKLPRLDNFNPSFYQTYWHIVGEEVTLVVLKFLNEGIFDNCINHNFIVLILKIKNPIKASNFMPISLCNMIYKLVSKVLDNRLKRFLLYIISKSQITFIPKRLIMDNVIVAYEMLHSIKT